MATPSFLEESATEPARTDWERRQVRRRCGATRTSETEHLWVRVGGDSTVQRARAGCDRVRSRTLTLVGEDEALAEAVRDLLVRPRPATAFSAGPGVAACSCGLGTLRFTGRQTVLCDDTE